MLLPVLPKQKLPSIYAKVVVKNLEPSDYQLGPSYIKEFFLVGKDKRRYKLRVMEKPSLFNKNFKVAPVDCHDISPGVRWKWMRSNGEKWNEHILKSPCGKLTNPTFAWKHVDDLFIEIQVSSCGESGCKDEPLEAEAEKRVFSFILSLKTTVHIIFCQNLSITCFLSFRLNIML